MFWILWFIGFLAQLPGLEQENNLYRRVWEEEGRCLCLAYNLDRFCVLHSMLLKQR